MTLEEQSKRVQNQAFMATQLHSVLGFPGIVYLFGVTCGLNKEEAIKLILTAVPAVATVCSISTYVLMGRSARKALTPIPGEPRGARISRLLTLPRIFELQGSTPPTLGAGAFALAAVLLFGKSPWIIPWTMVTYQLVVMLLGIQMRAAHERNLRQLVFEEFQKDPTMDLKGGGALWVRQRWYLPYVLGIFVTCSLGLTLTIVGRQGYETYMDLTQMMQAQNGQLSLLNLQQAATGLVSSIALPLGVLGAYLLLNAGMAAWSFVQNQSEGTGQVRFAMESLVAGTPHPPQWVSTDEVGELAIASAKVFGQLKSFTVSLGSSAGSLKESATQLGHSTNKQSEVMTRQAAALHETQVTTQEIKQTSALTAQKAEGILKQAEHVDEISRAGEVALQRTLDSIQEIGQQVREMSTRIKALDERTRQIANITQTVKDLADQSNMLALNAAIEAVRSGEHGKGFGVVAKEIRHLADQSVKATMNVRQILQDISAAIRSTVSITEKGSEKVASSLQQIQEFGGNMQQLATIVRENANSVRQISVAVAQQDTGIVQIFQAINDLSTLMTQTMEQFRLSGETLNVVRDVADQVGAFVNNYDWQSSPPPPPSDVQP
jgi:methyl-accepting chemotaxis protein